MCELINTFYQPSSIKEAQQVVTDLGLPIKNGQDADQCPAQIYGVIWMRRDLEVMLDFACLSF